LKRRWRDYRTGGGRRPVKEFLDGLSDEDAADVIAAMKVVAREGVRTAKHVESELYEVKAEGNRQTFRILFAQEGEHDQVLLALEAFSKKQERLPRETIELAKRRLNDWRARGRRAE
jgi:phage-related protein